MVGSGIVGVAGTLEPMTDTVVRHPETATHSPRSPALLPVSSVRTSTSSFRRLARWFNDYTLWAFNPQRPLGR